MSNKKNILYLKIPEGKGGSMKSIDAIIAFAEVKLGKEWEVFASEIEPNFPPKEKRDYEIRVEPYIAWVEKFRNRNKKK